jgi:hypothetical protein
MLPGKHFEVTQELPASLQDRARLTGEAAARAVETKVEAPRPKAEAPKAGTPSSTSSAAAKMAAKPGSAPGTPAGATDDGKGSLMDTPTSASSTTTNGTGKLPLTLVYFLGGVTFAEISALRYLSTKEGHGRDYLIATTKLINGSSLVDSICEHIQNNLRHTSVTR